MYLPYLHKSFHYAENRATRAKKRNISLIIGPMIPLFDVGFNSFEIWVIMIVIARYKISILWDRVFVYVDHQHWNCRIYCGHLLGKGWPLGSRLWCLTVSLSLSNWYPGSGVVLDCIDTWSLHTYLLGYMFKSTSRKRHNHRLQTNARYHEEETQSADNHSTINKTLISLSLSIITTQIDAHETCQDKLSEA